MKIISAGIFFAAILFMCIGSVINLQAQNEPKTKALTERIDDVTNKLQLKLLLTKEQAALVKNILSENISESILKENREKILKVINDKIESALTKKQKTKFSILKSKWLDEIIGAE